MDLSAKSLRQLIITAKENGDMKAVSQAENKLRSLAEGSDDVESHFHLAMIEPTNWSKTLKTEDIPEKLLFLFQQHPNAIVSLLLDDDLDDGKLAKLYLEAIYNNDSYRPYIHDDELLAKIRLQLKKRVEF